MKTLIGIRQKRGSVIRNPTLEQRRAWDREAVAHKQLPKDLHPHLKRAAMKVYPR